MAFYLHDEERRKQCTRAMLDRRRLGRCVSSRQPAALRDRTGPSSSAETELRSRPKDAPFPAPREDRARGSVRASWIKAAPTEPSSKVSGSDAFSAKGKAAPRLGDSRSQLPRGHPTGAEGFDPNPKMVVRPADRAPRFHRATSNRPSLPVRRRRHAPHPSNSHRGAGSLTQPRSRWTRGAPEPRRKGKVVYSDRHGASAA